MVNAGDNGLLAVWADGLHRRGLEHLPLQYSHCGGCTRRSQDSGRVTSQRAKVTGPRAKLPWHGMGKVTWWRVVDTCKTQRVTYTVLYCACIFKFLKKSSTELVFN